LLERFLCDRLSTRSQLTMASVGDALLWHRLQFAFTIVYHYLFPQLTMGLALYIVVLKILALRTRQFPSREVT